MSKKNLSQGKVNAQLIFAVLVTALITGILIFLAKPALFPTASIPTHIPESTTTTYKAQLPCADCPGINATLVLNKDGTYQESYVYQERPDGNFTTKGTWEKGNFSKDNPNQEIYMLQPEGNGNTSYYLLESNGNLTPLDTNFAPINSPFDQTYKRQ